MSYGKRSKGQCSNYHLRLPEIIIPNPRVEGTRPSKRWCFGVFIYHTIKIKLTCKATQSKKKNNNPNWLGAKHTKQCIICYISCWRSSISAAHSFITTQAPPSQPLREKCLIPHHAAVKMINKMGRSPGGFFRKRTVVNVMGFLIATTYSW